MKPVRKVNSTSQSCSCTSCIYKSESEQPSIKKYIAHGSRIDRLYFGKYIPLRERKLLNRLVRTRAVYDDLRARLISDSTLSLEKNADLRHRKHHQEIKPIGSSEKSGAILELVDFIDKGAVLGPKSMSECCSCCSCSSNEKILKTKRKEHRHKRIFARSYEGEYNQMQGKTGEKAFTKTYEREYGRKVHGRMRDRYNRRGVHFKARNIRSDPCTCTLKFSGLIKKHSKALIQKMRQVPLEEPKFTADEEPVIKKSKLHTMARKSYQKYKEIHKNLESDMKKLNESKENLKKNLQLNAKKSLEKVKQVKDKVKTNIESGIRKSIQAARTLQPKGKKYETTEYPEEETNFNIKKDSIVKFKEYLKRKNEIKDWECDLKCIPDECVPEECFRIIKLRRSQKDKRKRDRVRAVDYESVSKEVKVGKPQLQKTSSCECSMQTQGFTKTTATHVRKPMIHIDSGNHVMDQRLIFETKKVNKVAFRDGNQNIGRSSEIASPLVINREHIRSYDNKTKNVKKYHDSSNERETSTLKKDKSDTRSRQAVRIGSSFSFDVEFYKTRPESKKSRSDKPSDTLTTKTKLIRQHMPRRKRKKKRHRHKGSQVSLKSSLQSSQGSLNLPTDQYKTKLIQTTKSSQQMQIVPDIDTSVLLPFECEPFTCQPGECDPHECVKRLSSVRTNTPYDRKSVSSLKVQSTFATADKNVAKQIQLKQNVSQASLVPAQHRSAMDEISLSGKQAVRISSTFSFSIEFSKKGTQKESIAASTKETIKKVRNKKNYVSPKVKEIKTTSARAYNKAKTNVRKCFCTLKLHRNKNKVHTSTVGTVAALEYQKIAPSMVDKYVETKRNNRIKLKEYKLLPYECEPGICIPGECDPIYCNNILKLRNVPRIRHKTKGSYTSSRKTKSTSSIVSRSAASVKAKIVQSSMAPMKQAKTRSPRWPKENLILDPNNLRKTYVDAPGRQAVRVGSSFSFNIEFYKDKLTPGVENKPRIPKEDIYKKRKINQGTYFKGNKNNNSMFTQVINRDMNIGPPLKRCFCILKLNKNKDTKRIKRTKIPTAYTQTVDYAPSTAVNKGTKTKWSHSYNLLPFECEPNTCIPGECDPYLCLEKINLREINTRDHGVYTNTPEMRSISSYTDNPYKQSAAILVQPKLLDRGTRMKKNNRTYKVKPQQHAERSGDVLGSSNSKQAVRIGSSFNFSIEFSKQMPQVVQLSKYPKNKEAHPTMHTNRGIKVAKVRVDHADTQALEPRKRNKGILVHPMLKRCFCTLNLQKKLKKHHAVASPINSRNKFHQPNIYTVSTAMTTRTQVISQMFGFNENVEIPQFDQNNRMISISTSSFLLKKCAFNAMYSNFKLCPSVQIPLKLKQPLKINSSLSIDIEIIRDLKPCKLSGLWKIKQPIKLTSYTCTDDTLHLSKGVTSTCDYNKEKNTGISRCLQQCFCAMNVQIAHEGVRSKINMTNKLKPYECEPGICIPGECDPNECQKAIMRRLVRNVHRGSGTKSSNKSISSYATSNVGSDSRSTQFKPHTRKHSNKTKIFTEQHRHEYKHRQAVRVGSNFSFNIEFSKNLSQPFRKYDREETAGTYIRRPVNRKGVSREVQSLKTPSGRHGQSQSTTTSVHRATYTPKMKRCFCTLKLQKKGRLQRENVKLNTRTTEKMSSVESRNAKIGTKYRDVTKIDQYDLKAYECEPGICIPGQCDPYKCLERMKQKKELGINTSRFDERSISSMTNAGFINHRTRAVGVKPRKMHDKTTKRFTNSRIMKGNYLPNVESNSRQAVRIGSNFSFNIEFYKGSPQNGSASEYKETRQIGHTKKALEGNPQNHKKNLKETNSQSSKSVSNRDTQMKEHYNQTSTMTSSLFRRCFCTAKLQAIEDPNKEHTTFMQKCLCLLGLRNKKDKDYRPANNHIDTAEKRTNTDYRNKVRSHSLKPYECEPGICVPDQCDPYLCHKIIQKRLAKQYSKASETNSVRSQSVSSGIESFRMPKNERTQVLITKQNKKKQYQTKKDTFSNKSSVNESKRIVRIGSNFSFNVEFYKDNIKSGDTDSSKVYPSREVPITGLPKRRRLKTAETEIVDPSMRNNETQNEKKATRTFGSAPPLKRCFCTLKLLNKPAERPNNASNLNKNNTINVENKQKKTRNAKTQSHKQFKFQPLQEVHERQDLLPYECEPFICVPGQCDPVECLQRIRKRQTKDFGMSTLYHNTRSIGSVATKKKKKDQYLQARFKTAAVSNKTDKGFVGKPNAVQYLEHPRQAVRIGSNFSFNIEFFKDTGNDGSKDVSYFPKETSRQSSKKPISCNKQVQPLYLKHDADSQSIAVGKQDTQTKMADFKRCFCTLQLRNKEHKPIGTIPDKPPDLTNTKSNHSIVGELLKKCMCAFKLKKAGKQNQPQINAVKHEIKDVSIQSNDLRRKRIKMPSTTLEPYECEPYVCVPGECDPYECLKRIQKRKVRDFGTDYKRFVKDSATDSIRMQSTRSTDTHFFDKRKLNSRGTSFAAKRRRHSTDTSHRKSTVSPTNLNRQVVRIGSNFSFNIEFFKDHGQLSDNKFYKELKSVKQPKIKTQSEHNVNSKGSDIKLRGQRCQKSQCPYLKRRFSNSAANTRPKRCFCTLKLQKSDLTGLKEKPLPQRKTTENKMTGTKIKYKVPQDLGVYECPPRMCIPGECNPYECLDKMKKRDIARKSRNIATVPGKKSAVSVGNRTYKLKDHKIQSHFKKEKMLASAHNSEPQSMISKSPRVYKKMYRPNKRAVRIGSNFKFNVEFFKEKSQPAVIRSQKIVRTKINRSDSKSYVNKNFTVKPEKFRNINSQMEAVNIKNQSSNTANILKRCFCTLQLQKPTRQKMLRENNDSRGIKVKYPQSFIVGRAAIGPFNKNVVKTRPLKKAHMVKESKSTSLKASDHVRNVGTRTNKKYLQDKGASCMQCDPNSCPYYKNEKILGKHTKNAMQTILPYTPNKFHKKESKVLISDKHKLKEEHGLLRNKKSGISCDKCETSMFHKGKRLTAKKSKKSIPKNKFETKPAIKNSFLCRCAKIFGTRTDIKNGDGNKHVLDQRSPEIKLMMKPKKARNTKFTKPSVNENCSTACPSNNGETEKSILKHTYGIANDKDIFDEKLNKIQGARKHVTENTKMRVTFADNTKPARNDLHQKQLFQDKSGIRPKICYSCSVNDCPLKVDSKKDRNATSLFRFFDNSKRSPKRTVTHSESADDCQYCELCKRKIDIQEISKGGGDIRSTLSHKKYTESCPCDKEPFITKGRKSSLSKKPMAEKFFQKKPTKNEKYHNDRNPVIELHINAINSEIINKDELHKKISHFARNVSQKEPTQFNQNTKHGKKRQGQGATLVIPPKNKISKLFSTKTASPAKPSYNPCTCGSKECSKISKIMRSNRRRQQFVHSSMTPCVCGSNICSKESKKIKRMREHICSCEETVAKREAERIIKQRERKELEERLKIDGDKIRKQRLKRIKRNKELERRLKSYKGSSDVLLAVDSFLDIGKLGLTTLGGAVVSTGKALMDPKVAYEKCKCRKTDPESVAKHLQQRYLESDAAATAKRVKMRCSYMERVQAVRQKLEENVFTHFLLHIADKNAKTRKFKRKPARRVREPLDFECSLYMASLRKRPCLWVYYKYRWFYPHFITMLNVWKQFTDIMLFLLAAVVWSPCILCMEGCRALMCCFFCTG